MILLSSGNVIAHQVGPDYKGETVTICNGKFIFTQDSFNQAHTELTQGQSNKSVHYLIIDEIGPLELKKNQGLRNTLDDLMKNRKNHIDTKMIIVVRPSLKDLFISTYKLQESDY